MPGLDGVRAVAVLAVIAYHLGFGWASGGLLGVGVFFTLSGYLITDLLLGAHDAGKLSLVDFWLRRARRLLPALYLMLAVVALWVSLLHHSQIAELRGEAASAILYLNNWWQISQHVSYFARFGPPSPLNHLWSLAVEEQFYLIWPWLLLLGVACVRERRRPIKVRPRLAGVTLVLAVASAIEMAVLYHPSFDSTRIYEGTDTRACGLLLGAALAMVWPSRSLTTRVTPGARSILDWAGVTGLVMIGLLVWRTTQYSGFLYQGGIVLLSIATVLVVAAAAHPATRVGRALGWEPLRWLGVRSYGIYLWHEPIIVLTTPASAHGVNLARAAAQLAATIVVAALSWRYVEEPIRHGALGRIWARARSVSWQPRLLPGGARVVLIAVAALLVIDAVGLAGVRFPTSPSSRPVLLGGIPGLPPQHSTHSGTTTGHADAEAGRSATTTKDSGTTTGRSSSGTAPSDTKTADPHGTANPPASATTGAHTTASTAAASAGTNHSLRSSCRSVVHIGDSTSEGLTSSEYLPDPGQRMAAQYRRVGVTNARFEITGATSIVETLPGGENAYDVAKGLVGAGYNGCWVIALGTNDSADVAIGSNVGVNQRIARMMSVIGKQPAMWVNVKSLLSSGPYSETNMAAWDRGLVQACPKYPNMRVYDWASVVRTSWFIPDGIHYYSPGYAARAHLIANALAESFPQNGHYTGASCVVHTPSLSIPVLGLHK